MLALGKEDFRVARDVVREQQLPQIAQKVIESADAAMAAGASATKAAIKSVTERRDFVGQLVRGEI